MPRSVHFNVIFVIQISVNAHATLANPDSREKQARCIPNASIFPTAVE
jgi:hypothetical protein